MIAVWVLGTVVEVNEGIFILEALSAAFHDGFLLLYFLLYFDLHCRHHTLNPSTLRESRP